MAYTAPVKDMQFLLHHVMGVTALPIPGYADLEEAFTAAVLEAAGQLASDVLAPLNAVGDREGCRLENGVVRTPTGFKVAFDALRDGGWTALDCAPEYGGQGLPYLMHTVVGEILVSANMSLNMYQGLTHGAYSAINVHGTAEQKAFYLPKLASCEWTGTMNLTEPQCGTDLGLMRTRAEPQADGSYLVTGAKIFISAGDHDMADNIVHLVLAKAPGGGEGTKGISLFIVPKMIGTERNAVSVGKVEEKMGIHGNATCVMNYDGAQGWLLGDLHKGMRAMFTMMNEARLGVGLQGYAVAEAAYQASLSYARDRLQGRAITGAVNAAGAADPLIVHPDIRRALMDQKSFVEGARALTFWGASLIDRSVRGGDDAAEGLVSLLIPVIKGFQTDMGFQMAVQAQQIWGGHGYIEDNPASQFVRDARIAMIYEGANGVQALDLVGRKLMADGGKPILTFFEMVKAECQAHDADPRMEVFTRPLKTASKQMQAVGAFFMANGMKNPNAALAGATDFLHLTGHVAMGLMWTRMARAALTGLDAGGDDAFHTAKLATGSYYMARHLPACALHLARIESGADPVMALSAEAF
ncbi:MAG: acyl-CoA dehydrogenase C-terminal domain-containing protein [Candidatus Saccharibacteria bacterium]|nr:acyl-CoA dehydrogenase C-terminal domain-containing protein [Pseudorhodobacter sp.]